MNITAILTVNLVFIISLYLIVFTAVTGQFPVRVTVREGDDATLPCEDVIAKQKKCDKTDWISRDSGVNTDLVTKGRIRKNGKIQSDRLSLTRKCFLVVKKVTPVDRGVYYCQQHRPGRGTRVLLSILNGEYLRN